MNIPRRTLIASLLAAAALPALAATPAAEAWKPNRPIRVVVPFGPGGASDIIARMIQPALTEALGTAVVVENRAGAAGNIAMEAVAKSAPDGYTVFLGNISTSAINQWTYAGQLGIEPLRDLLPVSMIARVPGALTSSTKFPPNTVRELVDYVKKNPGKVNHTSAGAGSYAMLDILVLEKANGLDMVHVPYKGGAGQFIAGLVSGEVELAFTNVSSASELVKSGRLKALAVTSAERVPEMPNVPTMAEAGFPGIGTDAWQGFFVPAGTPASVVARLHLATSQVLAQPAIRESMVKRLVVPAPSASPADFSTFVAAETARWGKIVADHKAELNN
ncbi:MAG: tripartite tricarboxylate transporter substrate binding protein [Comamonadaceae bacterium]|nr:MAG: tripartite tricarboxylate transporter substrate binding protein [Comamonadaceae bacterium]